MDIVTIGEVLIDLTQTGRDERGIPQFAANPGGAPANLAVAAARLGAQTTFIGKVGEDAFGRYLTEVLQENKVDTRYMVTDADHPTTMAVVSVDAAGERDFSFYRSANADAAEPERHNFWERYHIPAGVRNGCPAKTIRGQRRPDRGTADGTVGHYHRYASRAHGGGTGTGTENHFPRPRDGGRRHRDPHRRSTAGLRSRGKGLQSGLRERAVHSWLKRCVLWCWTWSCR